MRRGSHSLTLHGTMIRISRVILFVFNFFAAPVLEHNCVSTTTRSEMRFTVALYVNQKIPPRELFPRAQRTSAVNYYQH
jgi:hypothetical protein